ncbi:MAG: adenylate/guanylate cyclase domain-containing protein [Deltaproteobacteria bacterium]|jgi:class 3 adenylate cyclase/CHASE2 domain-containing sensor protein|nr:adenylate/guanylate cyclase domain-containing protein [Deltaproteobacteria bacterium]
MFERLVGFLDYSFWLRIRLVLAASLILSFLGLGLSYFATNLIFENFFYDFMLGKKPPPQEPPYKLVLIAIDDESLDNPSQSQPEVFVPTVWATILDYLTLGGAKTVAIHRPLPASENRRYSLQEEAIWFRSILDARRSGLSIVFGFRWQGDKPLWPSAKLTELAGPENLGFLNLIRDRDSKVRRLMVSWQGEKKDKPSLSWAFLAAQTVKANIKAPRNVFYIDFDRKPVVKLSFNEVYSRAKAGEVDFFKRFFNGALVFVGETNSRNLDVYPDPFSSFLTGPWGGWSLTPAVEIQIQAVKTLLNESYLHDPGKFNLWLFFFCLSFFSLSPVALSLPRGRYRLAWMPAALLLFYPVFAFLAFKRQVFLPIVPGLTVLALANAFYWVRRTREARKRQDTSSQALNLYLNPDLAGRIIDDPTSLQRRGELREVTVLFTDLVGFTPMAESMETSLLVDLLNRYYERMNAAIEPFDGFVDKFVGDAIMAVWGAPSSQPEHAISACRSALLQKKYLQELNLELSASNLPALTTRMGLNTGQVIAGNIGAKHRINYTVMGDAVNLASRLVGVNKLFNTAILASEATAAKAKEKICFRILDKVRVMGRKGVIIVYEVFAEAGSLSPEVAQGVNFFERALKHYWDKDFTGALSRFEAALKFLPNDNPAEVMVGRCLELISHPPEPDWDAVTVLEAK